MCVIVDANKLSAFFDPSNKDAAPLMKWVLGGGAIVFSTDGRYACELHKANRMDVFRMLRQRYNAHQFRESEMSEHLDMLEKDKRCRSDDKHILALAIVSGARVLYTEDGALQQDFKNTDIINRPKGRIYSHRSHAKMLYSNPCKIKKKPR